MLALKHHGYLKPTDPREWQPEPEAIGVGPDGTAFAVWPHRRDTERKQVTSHIGGTDAVTSATIETALKVSFVQPLPDGQFLIAAARSRSDAPLNVSGENAYCRPYTDFHLISVTGDVLT